MLLYLVKRCPESDRKEGLGMTESDESDVNDSYDAQRKNNNSAQSCLETLSVAGLYGLQALILERALITLRGGVPLFPAQR